MTAPYFRGQAEFGRLCDLIASDRLVCVTGAGISRGLKRNDGREVPGWKDLLLELFADLEASLEVADSADCREILSEATPPGTRLIEVASILREVDSQGFDKRLRVAVTPQAGTYLRTHRAVLALKSRGIITFNYDDAHESAFQAESIPFRHLLPTDDKALADALRSQLRSTFLLKAHGSIESTSPLVLTYESYRQLIAQSPGYRAFVQNVLTNFNLVFVGFGLADPDFDFFIHTMANHFGSPLQEHVAIRHITERSPQEVELRRRYGIHTLYIDDYATIPDLLVEAASEAGPRLKQILDNSIEGDFQTRQLAHDELERLGPAGRTTASRCLAGRLTSETQGNRIGEIGYSLGLLDARANKSTLFEIVDLSLLRRTANAAGPTLTALRRVLDTGDLSKLRTWLGAFKDATSSQPFADDPERRIEKYLEYLTVYVSAHHSERITPIGRK